jgi:hypothetical protein
VSKNQRIRDIERRLEALDTERRDLVSELAKLRAQSTPAAELPSVIGSSIGIEIQNPDDKVRLFHTLFAARTSVYPKLWENASKGIKGYAPACSNEWDRQVCGKPKVKCTDCPNQAFLKLDSSAIRDHLQGKHTIGTYSILEDDSCTFLAADFDGKGWGADVIVSLAERTGPV